MAKTYYDQDVNWSVLEGKTVAVIGYGSQGHAHALNLKDSGVNVVIGLYEGSKSAKLAAEDGLKVLPVADAVKAADVTMVLIPDEKQAALYKSEIAPNLKPNSALAFAHGFNIHSNQIVPAESIDVIMVAPVGSDGVRSGGAAACRMCSRSDRTRRANVLTSRLRMHAASAARARASSRRHSRRRRRPISSASRSSSAAA